MVVGDARCGAGAHALVADRLYSWGESGAPGQGRAPRTGGD